MSLIDTLCSTLQSSIHVCSTNPYSSQQREGDRIKGYGTRCLELER